MLKDPQKRGEHLLALNDFDTRQLTESGTIEDKEFLLEVMEVQERIDTARETGDTRILDAERDRAQQAFDECVGQLSAAFEGNNLQKAKELLIKLSYYDRALQRCTPE